MVPGVGNDSLEIPRLVLQEVRVETLPRRSGGNCIKIGFPGKLIIRDYFQENMTSQRPFLLLRISFSGRPIFIQFVPGPSAAPLLAARVGRRRDRRPRVWRRGPELSRFGQTVEDVGEDLNLSNENQ